MKVFSKWLESFDREVAAQKRKVLLILDGRPCNLEPTLLGNVQLVILPRCCSGKFSAFTVNVLKEAKRKYRGELAKKVIRKLDLNEKPTVDILEAAFMIGRAWTKVKSKTIRDSFSRSGLFPELSPLQRISKTLCRKKYENSVDDVNGGHAEVDDEGEEEEHDDEDSVDDDNYDEEEESNDDIPLGILMDWLNCSNQDITMLEYSSFDDEVPQIITFLPVFIYLLQVVAHLSHLSSFLLDFYGR